MTRNDLRRASITALKWGAGFYLFYAALMSVLAHPALYQFDRRPWASDAFSFEEVTAGDGTVLPVAVHDAGPGSATILVFVGNVGSRAHFGALFEPLIASDATVVALPYRGAEGIPGWPREARLRSDAHKVFKAIPDVLDRDPGTVHLVGYSLGTGLALDLALRKPERSVLLIAPYARICEVMRQRSYLPACLMPWIDHWDSRVFARAPGGDVVILHGADDTLIPIDQSEKLADDLAAAGRLARHQPIGGAGHNDIFAKPATRMAIEAWVSGLSRH